MTANGFSHDESQGPIFVTEHIPMEISEEEFDQIRRTLQDMRGFNLDAYKDKCVRRRIAIRIRATHCESAKEYCRLLISQSSEVDLLLKVLTIHVSQFFRNFSTFEKLRLEILPYLFTVARQEKLSGLKFWSLGCAGGEEPYGLALLLADHFPREIEQIPVTIEGTDVDASILDAARLGQYNQERLVELPQHYLQRYFTGTNGQFTLIPSIRDMVHFRHGNIFHADIYQRCDLVLCRNVLIYFAREQQENVIRNIARALNPWGIMVLGKSETLLGESRNYFQTVCPVERIYRLAEPGRIVPASRVIQDDSY
ncbi:MAG TPA: protein-glutamate O-methyltransferase CheR [Geobacteraceae bacterium]|nr:protein-glutamate O-methyltransferase CheR [Geobacteraceae bacterium]